MCVSIRRRTFLKMWYVILVETLGSACFTVLFKIRENNTPCTKRFISNLCELYKFYENWYKEAFLSIFTCTLLARLVYIRGTVF